MDYNYKYIKYKKKYNKLRKNIIYDNKSNKSDLHNIPNILYFKTFTAIKGITPEHVYNKIKQHPNTELVSIKYKSDNLSIHGYIFKRKNLNKKVPVVIFCRGGNNKQYQN